MAEKREPQAWDCCPMRTHAQSCALPYAPCDCPTRGDEPYIHRPLEGHHGDCAKVLQGTVTGNTDVACTCGVQP